MAKAEDVKRVVASISSAMEENREYLISLDQQNGDGDLGISMDEGFKAVLALLDKEEEEDLGRLFMKASKAFNEAAPSSLGTILSIAMMGMAKELKGKTEAHHGDWRAAFEKGVAGIMEKAKSGPGEKTILDALIPGLEALKKAEALDPKAAFEKAFEAAEEGSERTREMKAVHGRAAYYGEKSIGLLDGGSVVGKLIFKGIRDAL